jgi:hypothetical protein
MLIHKPDGHYSFLKGIVPYSCGVVADDGWEIVRVTLAEPLPWRRGFDCVETYLRELTRDRQALCGMELRSPAPFSMQGFIDFNRTYCEVLASWGLYVDGDNPVARTNVAPIVDPPSEVTLHAFSYTVEAADRPATLVVAGAAELRGGSLDEAAIVGRGRVDLHAMYEKEVHVLDLMEARLAGLGGSWASVNAVDVYTCHPVDPLLNDLLWKRLGPALRHGVRLHHTRPPVIGLEFEMDVRGLRTDLVI